MDDPAEQMTMRERMVAGLPYRGAGETSTDSADAARATARFQQLDLEDREAADRVLRGLLGSMGEDVRIRPPFHVDYGWNIHVGDRLFANFGLMALDVCEIRIGDDVQIGPNVQLLTPTHPLNPADRGRGWEGGLPITIEDNVWLGGGVIVMPGVRIGRDSVIGAGAVVTRDVPPLSVAVGSPARVIKTIDPEERAGQFALESYPAAYREQVRGKGPDAVVRPAGHEEASA
jgi:maltose O-acetyltransferase